MKKHNLKQSKKMWLEKGDVGIIETVGDGILRIRGLEGVESNEMLTTEKGLYCLALNLEKTRVGALVFGIDREVKAKQYIYRTKRQQGLNVSWKLIGKVVDGLGKPVEFMQNQEQDMTISKRNKKEVKNKINLEKYETARHKKKKNEGLLLRVERKAPGIIRRERVRQGLITGIKVIDSLVPIGRGQRELILGDRQTGKTSLGLDAIIHQVEQYKKSLKQKTHQSTDLVVCVYVAIGQRLSTIARICEVLQKRDCMKYTIIVSAPASSPVGFQYMAPYTGCTIAEYFSEYLNADVLIIYDDLSKHAAVYRQMSLLLGRAPGREAYPGDVFYLHSRLLERGVKLRSYEDYYIPLTIKKNNMGLIKLFVNDLRTIYKHGRVSLNKLKTLEKKWYFGGLIRKIPSCWRKKLIKSGSVTALPVVETVEGDVSAYIPTNIISITDGQIYLDVAYFSKGIRPAINPGLSVSRVGSAAQNKMMKKIAGSLKLELAQFREVEEFAKFGSSLDESTRNLLARGTRLVRLLVQPALKPISIENQVLSICAGVYGFLDRIDVADIAKYEQELFAFVEATGLFNEEPFLNLGKEIDEELVKSFLECFTRKFQEQITKTK